MTDKEFHRNVFIVVAVIIIALLLWLWTRSTALAATQGASPSSYVPAGSPVFVINGQPFTGGPVNFPASIFNFPANTAPGQLNGGNCSCGCNGNGGTTYDFTIPGYSDFMNTLIAQASAANSAATEAYINSLGYNGGIFVSNATPTPFAGGTFGS